LRRNKKTPQENNNFTQQGTKKKRHPKKTCGQPLLAENSSKVGRKFLSQVLTMSFYHFLANGFGQILCNQGFPASGAN
jgi:hypothetical protein